MRIRVFGARNGAPHTLHERCASIYFKNQEMTVSAGRHFRIFEINDFSGVRGCNFVRAGG